MHNMNLAKRLNQPFFHAQPRFCIDRMTFGTMTNGGSHDSHFAQRKQGLIQSRKSWRIESVVVCDQKSHFEQPFCSVHIFSSATLAAETNQISAPGTAKQSITTCFCQTMISSAPQSSCIETAKTSLSMLCIASRNFLTRFARSSRFREFVGFGSRSDRSTLSFSESSSL